MVLDPTRPLIKLSLSSDVVDRLKRHGGYPPKPRTFGRAVQERKFSSIFEKFTLSNELELLSDPTGLAPERLMVFELTTSVKNFANAIKRVEGLSLIDEEELDSSEGDDKPVMYLLMPNMKALSQITSLWSRWQKDKKLEWGLGAWQNVFSCLRDLRPWGPKDRVDRTTVENLIFDIEYAKGNIPVEIELVFRKDNKQSIDKISSIVKQRGGSIHSIAIIECIEYQALLAELPKEEVKSIIEWDDQSIAGLDQVMFIRPQARMAADIVEESDVAVSIPSSFHLKPPIAALFDGVPVSAHPWLSSHLIVDDPFDLEKDRSVDKRVHGTAMASLMIHGDRNTNKPPLPLPRQIVHIPVFDSEDKFPRDRLVVDVVYQALTSLITNENDYCKNILIVNFSLGIDNYRFYGRISPLARLIDYFSAKYGILCVVSAGNIVEPFDVPLLERTTDIKALSSDKCSKAILSAIDNLKGQRRLLSPAETVNGLTVGALNSDLIREEERGDGKSRTLPRIDPYYNIAMSNPTSALGPGFANAVKPDILMAGSKEILELRPEGSIFAAYPVSANKNAGVKVATSKPGIENAVGWTGGTSVAAALASRTAHRIHDALEEAYQNGFTDIPQKQRAALLKALLVHSARWPQATRDFIKDIVGPSGKNKHVQQKDNIRRYIGYGVVDEDFAVSCAADRATFWTTGTIGREKRVKVLLPIPSCLGQARDRRIVATLAWFTPINVRRSAYRSVRLELQEPKDIKTKLAVDPSGKQPDANQVKRGTVISRSWEGDEAAVIDEKNVIEIYIQRQEDSGITIDEEVAFGLALTIEMPGVNTVYDQVVDMLKTPARIRRPL